jgi:hypothetical protein
VTQPRASHALTVLTQRKAVDKILPMIHPPGPSLNDIILAVLAAIGGVVHYLDVYLKGGPVPTWALVMTHAAVSGFCGYMTAQVVVLIDPKWAFISAGIGGYMGTRALDAIAAFLHNKMK